MSRFSRVALTGRRIFVAWVVLAALGLGAAWAALQTPRFDSTALVGAVSGSTATGDFVERQVERARSNETLDAVRARADRDAGIVDASISVEQVGNAVAIRARTTDPTLAQAIAELYADVMVSDQSPAEEPRLVLLAPATIPGDPSSPNVVLVATLSGVAGLAVAAVSAPAFDRRRGRRVETVSATSTVGGQTGRLSVEPVPVRAEPTGGPDGAQRVPRVPLEAIEARRAELPRRPLRSPVGSGPAT